MIEFSNSKLFKLLELFSPSELNRLIENVQTSILNGKKIHFELLKAILNNRNITKEELYNYIFPQKKYNDLKIRIVMSETTRIVSYFLSILQIENENNYCSKTILQKSILYNNSKLFQSESVYFQQLIDQEIVKDAAYFDRKYEFSYSNYQFWENKNRTSDFKFNEIIHDFDTAFIIKKLKLACEAKSHSNIVGHQYSDSLLEFINEFLKENQEFLEIPILSIYFSAYHLLENHGNLDWYMNTKKLVEHHFKEISTTDLKSIYQILINFSLKKINSSQLDFCEEAIFYYSKGIENRFLLSNNKISKFTYRNIVNICLKWGRADLAIASCENYKDLLLEEDKESSYEFAMAMIDYQYNRLQVAQVRLQKVDFKDHLYNLAAKTLLMKIYYENNEMDLLEFHLDAMSMYLLRKKLIGYHKVNYQNIINCCRMMTKVKNKDTNSKLVLLDKFRSKNPMNELNWFEKQLA